jgi:hypothetical protein
MLFLFPKFKRIDENNSSKCENKNAFSVFFQEYHAFYLRRKIFFGKVEKVTRIGVEQN